MQSIYRPTRTLLVLLSLCVFASMAMAQSILGPGVLYPATSEISDQKAGSILVFNFYSSNPVNSEDTLFNITNIHPTSSVFVHLFFLDGSNCAPADAFICLTPNQTVSFEALDVDPGVRGYMIAIAAEAGTGCPINFNYLIGDEFIHLNTGHQANLGAEAIAALWPDTDDPGDSEVGEPLPGCDGGSNTATLVFDGVTYNRLPRMLAVDSVRTQAFEGNDTRLIINRIGGDLSIGGTSLGSFFAVVYDVNERPASVTFTEPDCQYFERLTTFRVVPGGGLDNFLLLSGSSGWIKLRPNADIGILGAVLNFNGSIPLLNGGHNSHILTLSPSQTLVMPIFTPAC